MLYPKLVSVRPAQLHLYMGKAKAFQTMLICAFSEPYSLISLVKGERDVRFRERLSASTEEGEHDAAQPAGGTFQRTSRLWWVPC
jgi:hypothetical protein